MKKLLFKAPAFIIAMIVFSLGPGTALSAPAKPGDNRETEKAGDSTPGDAGETDAKKPRIFGFEAGYNGGYAEGTAPKSYFSQPYVNISLTHAYVKFTAGLSRFWSYQITNGEGGYETVNFTQPKVALSFYPYKAIELSGEYRYWTGDKSHYYRAHDGTGGFFLDFEPVSLGFSGNYKKTEYKFYSDDKKNMLSIITDIQLPLTLGERLYVMSRYKNYKKQNTKRLVEYSLSPVFTWHIIESTSLDFGYDYYYTDFLNPYSFKSIIPSRSENIIYYSHTGRIGVSSEPSRFFSLAAGISAGRGSDEYIMVGGDVEGVINLFDYVKLSAAYAPVYNIAPKMDPMKRKFLETRSYWSLMRTKFLGRRLNVNPFMRLKDTGKPFWNHSVSVNVSFRY